MDLESGGEELDLDAQQYHYGSLIGPVSTRLLRLAPGHDDEPVRCTLYTTTLEAAPSYHALSYTWGDASMRENLICDGRPLLVTKNLADALRCVRRRDHATMIWADAASINQRDVAERSQQVSMMRDIYGKASQVLVWLGTEAEGSDFAFDFLERLAGLQCQLQAKSRPEDWSDEERDDLLSSDIETSDFVRTFADVDLSQRLLIMDLFQRPWFRRVWIVQEVSRGNTVTVLCGKRSMDWTAFALGAKILSVCGKEQQLWPSGQLPFTAEISLLHIGSTLSRLSWLESLSLAELMYYAANYDATDPRDKLYALLGCSKKPMVYNFPVDYSLTLAEVNRQIAPLLFRESGSLDPLNFAQHEGDIPLDVPTWTPTYDAMRLLYNIGYSVRHSGRGEQRYGDAASHFAIDATELRMQGRLVATITDVSDLASTKLPEYDLWQWSPRTLEGVLDSFVLSLPNSRQPSAFRSFVDACFLGYSSEPGASRPLETDLQRDDQGRLLLALIFYYSPANVPSPAPAYLDIPANFTWRRRCTVSTDGVDSQRGRTVYETYNLDERFDHSVEAKAEDDLRLATVFGHYDIRDRFDETALHKSSLLASNACIRRKFFRLSGDGTVIGIGPGASRVGDIVMQPLGARTPFVLRPVGQHYLCVGECFIAGEMPGEPNALERETGVGTTTFVIR